MIPQRFNLRSLAAFAHDVLAAFAAWCLAYLFRFNFDIPDLFFAAMLQTAAWVVPVQAIVFIGFGLYRGLWRYASLPDLKRILLAVAVGAMAAPLVLFLLGQAGIGGGVPRTVILLAPVLLVLMMGGSRLLYRAWKEHRLYDLTQVERQPVLVLGAGDAGVNLVKELLHSRDSRVVGLLDDDAAKQGSMLHGVRVLGRVADLPRLAADLGVEHAIIAMPAATHLQRRAALDACAAAGIKAMTVPSYDDLISGKVTVSQIRAIELDDLLGRDPVTLDSAGLEELLGGQAVLVSGAGGSIGAELCRQIARFGPRLLVMFEINEFALYRIEQEFTRDFPELKIVCALGDCKHEVRVAQVLQQYQIDVVFHAAAYKHVPLLENDNAWEGIKNNVQGTRVMAVAAVAAGVKKFVLVSTDKAVNPTNVMGASKRLAEMVCQALQKAEGGRRADEPKALSANCGSHTAEGAALFRPTTESHEAAPINQSSVLSPQPTGFVIVRFGNVLGSTGSVIPKFREQIAAGGPVTVTHAEITRYFMSIPEAAQLVMQAGLMGGNADLGGETRGEIFVLDMGEPVKIADLARDLIRLSGYAENQIEIKFTGLRPGEKLYEELLADDENTLPTPHPKLRIAKARSIGAGWLLTLTDWLEAHPSLSDDAVKTALEQWVPEYRRTDNK